MASSAREFMGGVISAIQQAGGIVALSPHTRVLPDDRFGVLRGAATFDGGCELHFVLVIDSSGDTVSLRKYRFHLMSRQKEMVFRYDNTRHHRPLGGFPHHKHVGAEETVVESRPPDIRTITEEIRAYIEGRRSED